MATFSITLGDFLISRYEENFQHEGNGTDPQSKMGDFIHYNKIISKTFNEPFKDMELRDKLTDKFKKDFCKRFYDSEIGREVVTPFLRQIENVLNNDCHNLLETMNLLENMTEEEKLQTIDLRFDSKAKNNGIGLGKLTPEKDLNIIYDQESDKKIIHYANNINEAHGKNTLENHTYGWTGQNKFLELNQFANVDDLQTEIFNICETCFIQLYG